MPFTDSHRIFAGIGEVLFDVFEDGQQALGGAPLNVAVHAHQLAAALGLGEGIVVSSVGDDAQGRQLFSSIRARGMSTRRSAAPHGPRLRFHPRRRARLSD